MIFSINQKDDVEALPGYLSLHQGPDGLSVKWTPNQLMNGCCEEDQSAIDRRYQFSVKNYSFVSIQNTLVCFWHSEHGY